MERGTKTNLWRHFTTTVIHKWITVALGAWASNISVKKRMRGLSSFREIKASHKIVFLAYGSFRGPIGVKRAVRNDKKNNCSGN